MKLGENHYLLAQESWVNHFHQVSWGLDKNCGFFTNGQSMGVSGFFLLRPYSLWILLEFRKSYFPQSSSYFAMAANAGASFPRKQGSKIGSHTAYDSIHSELIDFLEVKYRVTPLWINLKTKHSWTNLSDQAELKCFMKWIKIKNTLTHETRLKWTLVLKREWLTLSPVKCLTPVPSWGLPLQLAQLIKIHFLTHLESFMLEQKFGKKLFKRSPI